MPFYPPKNQKSTFCKTKKFAGYIIILHMCTKNHNHMMYSSWDAEWDGQHFFHFDPENQNFEKKNEKNAWRYHPFIDIGVP